LLAENPSDASGVLARAGSAMRGGTVLVVANSRPAPTAANSSREIGKRRSRRRLTCYSDRSRFCRSRISLSTRWRRACGVNADGIVTLHWQYTGDVSYTCIVSGVEAIRIPRVEGCGPIGGADVCIDGFYINT